MPGVTIALRGPESRSTVTDSKGAFAFTALPLGDYELRASLVGFSTVVLKLTVEETMPPLTIRMRLARSAAGGLAPFATTGCHLAPTRRSLFAPTAQPAWTDPA